MLIGSASLHSAEALIWTPDNKATTSASAIAAALSNNGRSTQTAADIKSLSLAPFDYIFICLGMYPNNAVLKSDVHSTEISSLLNYLDGGGTLYMEGGDTWARDFPTNLHSRFNLIGEADGEADLSTLAGASCLQDLEFNYSGAQNYVDHIAPQSGAALFFINTQPAYGAAVAYDNGAYRTVGASFEFGGLANGSSTKNSLMDEILDFFDSGCTLSKPAPVNLQAFSGYDHAAPLMWDAPPGQMTLGADAAVKPELTIASSNSFSHQPRRKLADQPRQTAAAPMTVNGYQSDSYNVYRSTSANGPYTKIASKIKRQYYRDMSAQNDQAYYYAVSSVYGGSESSLSYVASATPTEKGFTARSSWARHVPNLDGEIVESEWDDAQVIDITNQGQTLPVKLYIKNRLDYLYLAVDQAANTSLAVDDQVGIYIDQNRDGEWSDDGMIYEGNFWFYWKNSAVADLYRPLDGWWPSSIEWDDTFAVDRSTGAASTASGHVQFELRFELSDLSFVPPSEVPLNLFIFALDQPDSSYRAVWPTGVLNTVWSDAWLAPILYASVTLAAEESCEKLSESVVVSSYGVYTLNDPGDGHAVSLNVTALSGSGEMSIEQINCPYTDLPCMNELPLYWRLDISAGISSFNTDVSFSYTDEDAAGYTESEAFWGIAWYNDASSTWTWKGGAIDAVSNTVTVQNISQGGCYVLFRRIFGDISGDGYVDLDDYQRFGDVWNAEQSGEFPEGTDAAFFNCSKTTTGDLQIIDLDDFQVFGDVWNHGIAP